ncbi:hypothetical protein BH23GEM2_BH23GEM2_11190 [soil metagenome]
MTMSEAFRFGGRVAWILTVGVFIAAALSVLLLGRTAELRYERDVNRMVFNDNLGVLDQIRTRLGMTSDSLARTLAATPAAAPRVPYIVVSLAERHLWYKNGNETLFEVPIAAGSGKELVSGTRRWRFETPRGRLVVLNKEEDPAWVPPDWHYIEQARKRGLGVVRLERGQSLATPDGGAIYVAGSEVVRRSPEGAAQALGGGVEGREIVTGGNIIIPPFGTNARRYQGVLGTHRLNMGDGYAIHGTNKPETIGQAVSHGCIRMRNEDIARLYSMVPVGTPVYIY